MKFLAVWVLVLFPKHTLPFARGEIDLLSNEGVSTFAYSINMWTSCLVFNLLNSYLLVVQNPEETSTLITVLSPEQKRARLSSKNSVMLQNKQLDFTACLPPPSRWGRWQFIAEQFNMNWKSYWASGWGGMGNDLLSGLFEPWPTGWS